MEVSTAIQVKSTMDERKVRGIIRFMGPRRCERNAGTRRPAKPTPLIIRMRFAALWVLRWTMSRPKEPSCLFGDRLVLNMKYLTI